MEVGPANLHHHAPSPGQGCIIPMPPLEPTPPAPFCCVQGGSLVGLECEQHLPPVLPDPGSEGWKELRAIQVEVLLHHQ